MPVLQSSSLLLELGHRELDLTLLLPNGESVVLQYRLESPSIDLVFSAPVVSTSWKDDDLTPAESENPFRSHQHKVKQVCFDLPPVWVDGTNSTNKENA